MDTRRRQSWNNYRRRPHNRIKPPRGNWQPAMPAWEKRFCKEVGSIEWETFVQAKKFTYFFVNVINWNDSAGEEAFSNAKKRYWAKTNNLPCDIELPDPDLYIDEINWDSKTDHPELQLDLESEPVISNAEDQDHEPVIIFGDALLPIQASFSGIGWGAEFEDNLPQPQVPANQYWAGNPTKGNATGWGVEFEDNLQVPTNQYWAGNPTNGNATGWGVEFEDNLQVPTNQYYYPINGNATGWGVLANQYYYPINGNATGGWGVEFENNLQVPANQYYPINGINATGWGVEFEDNLQVPPANQYYPINVINATGWGVEFEDNLAPAAQVPPNQYWAGNPMNGNATGWEENLPANQWEQQNWGNNATAGWPSYTNNACNYNNPSGYMAWGGGDGGCRSNNNNNNNKKGVASDKKGKRAVDARGYVPPS